MTQRFRNRLRAIILALSFAASGGVAVGQSIQPVSQSFSMTAVGNGPAIALGGQSSCAITLNNVGTGLTLVPQVTSDSPANIAAGGAIWSTATTINAGSISTYGNYVGNVAGIGLTGFRFVVTALSSGTVAGSETCTQAIGIPGGGGATDNVNLTQVGGAAIALGQTTMSASLPVAIASNQSAIPVSGSVTALQPYSGTSDAQAATAASAAAQTLFNGTTMDRWRDVSAANPGIGAVGVCDLTTAGQCTTVNSNGELSSRVGKNGTYAVALNGEADATSSASVALAVGGLNFVLNGTTWDRTRSAGVGNNVASTGLAASAGYGQYNTTLPALSNGNYGALQQDAASILLATTGGAKTATIAAATAGPTVIKNAAGRLVRVVITTVGTTGTETFYDNASACSGTIIGTAQGTTAVVGNVIGTILFFEMPAANGITACGGVGSAAITASYY